MCYGYIETNSLGHRHRLSSGSNDTNVGNEGKEIDQEYNFKRSSREDIDQENDTPQFKMVHFFRGLLSYSRLWGVSRRGSSSDCKTSRATRFSMHFLRT